LPSKGRYGIVIVGEGPGRNENKEGSGFVGKAGYDILWPELEKHGLERWMFHVTNVFKCWPDKISFGNKHVKACRHWLDEELDKVKPFLILAFGNTCMRYFKGKESGIMDMSGSTEWDARYSSWITWCVHPASVLYSPANKDMFEAGIEEFAERVRVLGGLENTTEKSNSGYNMKERKTVNKGFRPMTER
jgi:DNA polymerase